MNEPSALDERPFPYVVVCACGVAGDIGRLTAAAQGRGWNVSVVATPQGPGFLDVPAVETRTGYPIRSAWRAPGDPRPLPPADAITVAPASFSKPHRPKADGGADSFRWEEAADLLEPRLRSRPSAGR